VVGNGLLRVFAAGEDGRLVKSIAFRLAVSPLGEALLAAPPHRKLWLAGRIKRDDYNGGNAAELHLEDAAWAD
jgi:single-stranded-DNA-specific exonuclease